MGLYDDVKAAAQGLARLSRAERDLSDHVAESRRGLGDLRAQVQDLRERQARIEARLDAVDELVAARAQAIVAAGLAAALAGLAERIARLEASAAPKPAGRGRPARLTGTGKDPP